MVDAGADAVVVSNHGGRQLDRAPVPLRLLPDVVQEPQGRAEVWVDTGIMCGADIVAARALGADAALVGRAYLYGLMAGGERGVERAAQILTSEVRRTMQLLGVQKVAELGPHARDPALTASDVRTPWPMTDIIEFTPTFEQYAFTFGGVAPSAQVAPGTVLRLWSEDAFCGALRSVTTSRATRSTCAS